MTEDYPATNPIPRSNLWDLFEHLALFVSLYVFATSFGLLLHFYIDKYQPDTTKESYTSYSTSDIYSSITATWQESLVRGYIATLIVTYPLFLYLFIRIMRRNRQFPILRQTRGRKILIYFTLFITFCILLGNVTSLVYSFLSGNITLNLILHLLTTTTIAGLIFGYYTHEVKSDRQNIAL